MTRREPFIETGSGAGKAFTELLVMITGWCARLESDLISERTKEELRAGRTLFAAINEGFARAWPSIRDSNVATLITAVVLFWFGDRLGTSVMQGFALTLGIGTLVSMFTAFFASRVISRALASTPLGNRLTLWVPVGEVGAERAARSEHAAQAGD